LVILTGMSGAGKSTALRCFEDLGYYCIDNLPPTLIDTFLQLYSQAQQLSQGIAVVCDVRLGELLDNLNTALDHLRAAGHQPEIVFLDCENDRLVDRFKETRRRPPLGASGRVEDALAEERRRLDSLREQATHIIDTTDLTANQLRSRLLGLYSEGPSTGQVSATILTFGFKHGVPADADFVFDTRMLPNPFYVEKLRDLTGKDAAVREYVLGSPSCLELLERIFGLVDFGVRNYTEVHKFHTVVAIGCTGGKHRSVALGSELAVRLSEAGMRCDIQHRDIEKI